MKIRIQLITDPEYREAFTRWVQSVEGFESVETNPDLIFDLRFLRPAEKLASPPSDISDVPILTNTLTHTATAMHSAIQNLQLVGAPLFPNYSTRQKLVELMLPLGSTHEPTLAIHALDLAGKSVEFVGDAVGGVFPRSLSMMINEAAFAVQEGVATAQDIDTAMKLGTNYPIGPLAWCDEIGPLAVVSTLDALSSEYGQERYRPASLLRKMAGANAKFLSE